MAITMQQKEQLASCLPLLILLCIVKLIVEAYIQYDVWSLEILPEQVIIYVVHCSFILLDLLLLATAMKLGAAGQARDKGFFAFIALLVLFGSLANLYVDGAYLLLELNLIEQHPIGDEFNYLLIDANLNVAMLVLIFLNIRGHSSAVFGWLFMLPLIVFKAGQFFEPQWLEIQENSIPLQWAMPIYLLIVTLLFGAREEELSDQQDSSDDVHSKQAQTTFVYNNEYWQQHAGLKITEVNPLNHPLLDKEAARICYGKHN